MDTPEQGGGFGTAQSQLLNSSDTARSSPYSASRELAGNVQSVKDLTILFTPDISVVCSVLRLAGDVIAMRDSRKRIGGSS
jgi:hypothetical protein